MPNKQDIGLSRQRRWPDPLHGPYVVQLHFDGVDGRSACVGVEVWGRTHAEPGRPHAPLPGVTPVTAQALRLPLGRLVQEHMRTNLALGERRRKAIPDPASRREAYGDEERLEAVELWEKRGRRGAAPVYGPSHWQLVADVYSDAWAAGKPPRQAVVDYFTVSKSTGAKWVARARKAGLLAPTSRGVAGGVRPATPTRKRKAKTS